MHEMGVASSILDAARYEAARFPGSRPSRVGVRVGEWSGVDTESLQFCFEALVAGTDLAGLQLEIDYRVRRNLCGRCGREFAVVNYDIRCPDCGHDATIPADGGQLDIAYVELEE